MDQEKYVMKLKGCFPLASLAVAVAAASGFSSVNAQEVERSASRLEEVVVTARRREESLQDVPVAITALDEDFLRSQNVMDLNDLGTHVPSMRISVAGTSTNQPIVSIRGQRPSTSTLTGDQAVQIYFNDIVMTPSVGSNLALYDLANVQVLKGPQGTLYGRNSTGGSVLVTPKTPGNEVGGYLETRLGNYNSQLIEGAVDLPVSDTMQFRLSGRMLDRDGYQENVADNDLNGQKLWDEHSKAARVVMNWDVTDRLNNLAVVDFVENDMRGRVPIASFYNPSVGGVGLNIPIFNASGQFVPGLGSLVEASSGGMLDEYIDRQAARDDPTRVESDIASRDNVRNIFVSNTSEYEFTDSLSFKSILGYRKVHFATANDGDGTIWSGLGAYTPVAGETVPNPLMPSTDTEQYSTEFQLLGDALDGSLEWLAGLYWYQLKGGSDDTLTNSLGTFSQGYTKRTVENTSKGIFAEATYHFSEQWSLTFGARQSWDDREFTVEAVDIDRSTGQLTSCGLSDDVGPLPISDCELSVSEDYSKPTGRISLNFKPDDTTLVYASVATGYRAGGFSDRGTDPATLKPYDEETVTTYEIGHKADWSFSWSEVRTNAAVFYQAYDDIQKEQGVVNSQGNFATATTNAGKAAIQGFEFDITLMPTENLSFNLAYSYIDAEYKEWDAVKTWSEVARDSNGNVDMTAVGGFAPGFTPKQFTLDNSDADFAYIPEQSLTASATYALPVDASLGEMSVMATVYWQDEMVSMEDTALFEQQAYVEAWSDEDLQTAYESTKIDAYEVWNFRFDWRQIMGSGVDFSAYVNNAFDEQYVTGGLAVISSLGFTGYTYGAPRTFGASLRYSF